MAARLTSTIHVPDWHLFVSTGVTVSERAWWQILRLAIEHLNNSDARTEEEKVSTIALSNKATKLMVLCDLEGFKSLDDLLRAAVGDSVCPAICMTEGCNYTTEMEPDQTRGYCESCGGNTMASALVLAGLI